jgi:DNA-binding HxlR family transcriptional regulator
MGRKAEAKNRIREALHEGRLSWTDLQKKTKLGKGPLSKNLRLMLKEGEVRYKVDEKHRPARGYYELAESGQASADIHLFFKRAEKTMEEVPDFLTKMSEKVFLERFRWLVVEIVNRFASDIREDFKDYLQKHWLDPYGEFFVKVWIDNSTMAMQQIGEILAMAIVSRALCARIPFPVQLNIREATEEYKRYREELIKGIESSSEVFDKYSELISKTIVRLIENLDYLILTEEILKRKKEKPDQMNELIEPIREVLEKGKTDKEQAVDLPIEKALQSLKDSQ